MNFYKRFMGDFQRKTGHLSLAQVGAYDRLLDHYYATGGPLPADVQACWRIAGAMNGAERAAVTMILGAFFTLGEDGLYHQARADLELEQAKAKIDAARTNGRRGGRPATAALVSQEKPTGLAQGTQSEPSGKARQSQRKKEIPSASHSPPAAVALGRFDRFWQAYPRKVGKREARRVFERLKPDDALLVTMLSAVEAQRSTEQWRREGGQYVPHPSTWLHEGRWEDETSLDGQGVAEPWHESRAGVEAMGERLGIGRWDQDAFEHATGPDWFTYRARVRRAANAGEPVKEAAHA